MKSNSNQPLMRDVVSVQRRYVRAVNIERDLGDAGAFEGYLLTRSVQDALGRLCMGLAPSSAQRAWRLTGSFGSGKSALGLFWATLFNQPLDRQNPAFALLQKEAPTTLQQIKKLPRYAVVALSATRSDPSVALAFHLKKFLLARRASTWQKGMIAQLEGFIADRQLRKCPPARVIDLLQNACANLASGSSPCGGLLLIVDEMGRWLEYAADPDSDVDASFFQVLAEAAGGRPQTIPIALVGILHQRFEDYIATRRHREIGKEWSKVAERFEEITFSEPFESTCQMIMQALRYQGPASSLAELRLQARSLFQEASKLGLFSEGVVPSEDLAPAPYPLHPTTLAASVTLFRRFGQNERSAFSFLQSSEPFALQDYCSRHSVGANNWYRLENLCDWLLAQGSFQSTEEERLKRWALLQEAFRSAVFFDEWEAKVLKVVGVLNLLEPQPGFPVSPRLVAFAIADDAENPRVHQAITQLLSKSILYSRPSSNELCLWPQGSVDVAAELKRIRSLRPPLERLDAALAVLPPARPVVAHRHYLETGTLRVARVQMVGSVEEIGPHLAKSQDRDGKILIIPCYPRQSFDKLRDKLIKTSKSLPLGVTLCLRRITEEDLEIAEDLLVWKDMEADCTELRVDAHARNEVKGGIERLSALLIHRLGDLRSPGSGSPTTALVSRGAVLDCPSGHQLNQHLSRVFDELYCSSPIVRNELINRSTLSSAAAGARQRLIELMFSAEEKESLGIDLWPPEKAIYLSVLRQTGLHAPAGDNWAFVAPVAGAPGRWFSAWQSLAEILETRGSAKVDALIAHFAAPPFGMHESLTLLMLVAYLRVHQHDAIIRERGTYVAKIDAAHLARFAKRQEAFEIHALQPEDSTKRLLEIYAKIFGPSANGSAPTTAIGSVIQQVFRWYLALPAYTLNTNRLEPAHKATLALLARASEPVELLTQAVPESLLGHKIEAWPKELAEFERQLRRFHEAVNSCLDELRQEAAAAIAQEAGVGDASRARERLRGHGEDFASSITDYSLRSLLQRSQDPAKDDRQWLDSVASLLSSKGIENWADETLASFKAELQRVFVLLHRVVTLTQANGSSRKKNGVSVFGVHVVDRSGRERFITIPEGAEDAGTGRLAQQMKALLDQSPSPAYELASLLLHYTAEK